MIFKRQGSRGVPWGGAADSPQDRGCREAAGGGATAGSPRKRHADPPPG